MASKKDLKGDLAAKVNFPLYCVEMLTDRHFVVAGGGGAARTGVANGFAMYQLTFNGDQCVAHCIGKHDTGLQAVMNCAAYEDRKGKKTHFVAGRDNYAALYYVSKKFEMARSLSYSDQNENSEKSSDNSARKRKPSAKDTQQDGKSPNSAKKGVLGQKQLRMIAHPMEMVKTVQCANNEVYQKVVRISMNGRLMATGGSEGTIALWQFPTLKSLREIKAHKNEVDDMDFSPDGQKLVSVSRDGCAYIWYTKDGNKVCALDWTPPKGAKYVFRRCRFSVGESEGQRPRLFTVVNPTQPKLPSFLQSWDTSSFLPVKSIAHTSSAISELAVSPCGKFVAIASMSGGCINIYTSFNLQLIHRAEEAHSNFITGLSFVPCQSETGQAITGGSEGAVISVSVDNQIRVHRIPPRPRYLPLWLAIIIIVSVVSLSFVFCSYLGL